MGATGDKSDLATLDTFVDRIDALVKLIGWYVNVAGDRSWAISTYGPTSVTALLGTLDAEYAYILGPSDTADARVAWATELYAHIDENAWNAAGGYYELGDGRPGPDLYPNVAMIAFASRLYELTKDEQYKTRALALYDAIQPLKLTTNPTRYYSAYSAMEMGAKTRDYSTLSSQSYLSLALMLLYEITGRAHFISEMDSVVDAMASLVIGTWCLSNVHTETCAPACGDPSVCVVSTCEPDACHEGLLHHWMDGRVAIPTDPTFFCSGCNLQMLYVMQYRRSLR
jgi:hypothetical protein